MVMAMVTVSVFTRVHPIPYLCADGGQNERSESVFEPSKKDLVQPGLLSAELLGIITPDFVA